MNQHIGKAASCYITPTIYRGTTEMVNTTIITNQLNTLIRQYTLTFLITFPLIDFCSGKICCKTIRNIYCLICVIKTFVIVWYNARKMPKIKIQNCSLLSYRVL